MITILTTVEQRCFDFYTELLRRLQEPWTEDRKNSLRKEILPRVSNDEVHLDTFDFMAILDSWEENSFQDAQCLCTGLIQSLGYQWTEPEVQTLFQKYLTLTKLREDQFLIIWINKHPDRGFHLTTTRIEHDESVLRALALLPQLVEGAFISREESSRIENAPIVVVIPPPSTQKET